jgi:hypothetical protein
MARTVELTGDELNFLLTNKEINVPTASRSIQIFTNKNEKELLLNYEGQGYRPIKVTIEFEYDENIHFSEGDD